MNEIKNVKAGQFAGIAYIVIAGAVAPGHDRQPVYPALWTFLEIASYGYLAVLLMLKRKDFLIAIGFGLPTILALRGLFVSYGFLYKLVWLLQVLAYAAMTCSHWRTLFPPSRNRPRSTGSSPPDVWRCALSR